VPGWKPRTKERKLSPPKRLIPIRPSTYQGALARNTESSTASNSEHFVKNFLPERLPVQEYYYEVTQVRALGVFGEMVLVLVCQMIPYSAGRMSSTSMYWDFPILRELAFDFLSIPAVS
jgi:hypothetical protein